MPSRTAGESGKVQVSLGSIIQPGKMQQMRREVTQLKTQLGLGLQDCSTGRLLAEHVQRHLFCKEQGFHSRDAGVFEMRRSIPWRTCFEKRPGESYFARGLTRFGTASRQPISPNSAYRQDLNTGPDRLPEDDVLLIAYQYGLVAGKV